MVSVNDLFSVFFSPSQIVRVSRTGWLQILGLRDPFPWQPNYFGQPFQQSASSTSQTVQKPDDSSMQPLYGDLGSSQTFGSNQPVTEQEADSSENESSSETDDWERVREVR